MENDVEFIPVIVKDEVIVYDIYIAGEWQGSRRTMTQALEQANRILGK